MDKVFANKNSGTKSHSTSKNISEQTRYRSASGDRRHDPAYPIAHGLAAPFTGARKSSAAYYFGSSQQLEIQEINLRVQRKGPFFDRLSENAMNWLGMLGPELTKLVADYILIGLDNDNYSDQLMQLNIIRESYHKIIPSSNLSVYEESKKTPMQVEFEKMLNDEIDHVWDQLKTSQKCVASARKGGYLNDAALKNLISIKGELDAYSKQNYLSIFNYVKGYETLSDIDLEVRMNYLQIINFEYLELLPKIRITANLEIFGESLQKEISYIASELKYNMDERYAGEKPATVLVDHRCIPSYHKCQISNELLKLRDAYLKPAGASSNRYDRALLLVELRHRANLIKSPKNRAEIMAGLPSFHGPLECEQEEEKLEESKGMGQNEGAMLKRSNAMIFPKSNDRIHEDEMSNPSGMSPEQTSPHRLLIDPRAEMNVHKSPHRLEVPARQYRLFLGDEAKNWLMSQNIEAQDMIRQYQELNLDLPSELQAFSQVLSVFSSENLKFSGLEKSRIEFYSELQKEKYRLKIP